MNTETAFIDQTQIPNQSQEELEESKSLECPICYNDQLESQLFLVTECNHSFCKVCLYEYLTTQISDFKVLKLHCPQSGCQSILKDKFLEAILDQETFQKYQRLVLQKLNNRGSKIKICPQPGCSKPITPLKDSPFTKCACETLVCNLCDNFWHEGKTCIEALDKEFQVYVKENNLKFCLMCKTMIARVEGCLHMTCSVCDYEWCWICGREYTEGHDWKCPKEWSPIPPQRIRQEVEKINFRTKVLRVLIIIFVFMILFPFKTLFWPFWIFNVRNELLSPQRKISEKLMIVSGALFFSGIYLGVVACGIWLMIFFKYLVVFGIMVGTILFMPWGLQIAIAVRDAQARNNLRWVRRNAQNFNYTSAQRPQFDLENIAVNHENNVNNGNNTNNVSQTQIGLLKHGDQDSISMMKTGTLELSHLPSLVNDRSQIGILNGNNLIEEQKSVIEPPSHRVIDLGE